MYIIRARRLLSSGIGGARRHVRLPNPNTVITGPCRPRLYTAPPPALNAPASPSPAVVANLDFQAPPADAGPPGGSESAAKSSSSSETRRRAAPRAEYQEEQTRVLCASLRHVLRLGWCDEAMMAGARDAGLSPSIVGAFSRKEAALVEFFMDECLQKLIDVIDSGEGLQNLVPSERVSKLVRTRLEMQAPFLSKWPQALSIQAYPSNFTTSFKQRALLVDEIWHAAGEYGSDIDWYVRRTVLGGIYSTTEIYMLADSSPDFQDTWEFLNHRVKDAFDLKKSMQEAQYLAEAVVAGLGNSFQGFVKKVFQNQP